MVTNNNICKFVFLNLLSKIKTNLFIFRISQTVIYTSQLFIFDTTSIETNLLVSAWMYNQLGYSKTVTVNTLKRDESKTIRCTAIGSLTYLEIPVYDINTIYAMLYTKFNKWHSWSRQEFVHDQLIPISLYLIRRLLKVS